VSAKPAADPAAAEEISLTSRVLRSAFWASGGYMASQAMRLGGNLILARVLAPEVFGLMAIVNSVRTGMELVSDIGIAPSVIRSPRGAEPAFLASTFSIQALRGALLWAITLLGGIAAASFYGEGQLRLLIPVAGASLLLAGFNSPGVLLLRRNLEQRRLQAIELTSQLVALAVSIGWVLIEPSVWGLVAGGVAAAATRLALGHWLTAPRARFGWERASVSEILRFGSWVLVSTLLTFLADHADRLTLGKMIPLAALGVYSIASMFATLPGAVVDSLGDSVVMPAFSRSLERCASGVERTFARVKRPIVAAGGALLCVGFAVAPVGIELLYDERYLDAGWMIQVIVAGAWFHVLGTPHIAALIALGEMRRVAAGNAAKFAGIALGVPLGFHFWGLPGALAGLVGADLFRLLVVSLGGRSSGTRSLRSDILLTVHAALAGGAGWLAVGAVEWPALGRALLGAGVALLLWSPQLRHALRSEQQVGISPDRSR
jgi:O-antigen/teichoic acid export membrane protein